MARMDTKYPDVNEVLTLLSKGLIGILGNKLIGLYLTGSLTYGDFDYGSSDIDFLAVIAKDLSNKEFKKVKDLHGRISKNLPYWAKRIEGSYITRDIVNSEDRPEKPRLYVNGGKINYYRYGNEWLINLQALHESAVAITGTDPKKLFPKVSIEKVRNASKSNLIEEWLPKLKKVKAFTHKDYESAHLKAYAILTMCRILYCSKNNSVASKRVAAAWVKKTYGREWRELVEKAERWQHGQELVSDDKVKDFIRFTYAKIRMLTY